MSSLRSSRWRERGWSGCPSPDASAIVVVVGRRRIQLPAVTVAVRDLGLALQLFPVVVLDAERPPDVVHDILVRRGVVAARGLVDVFVAGLFTGLLPCGLLYGALAAAAGCVLMFLNIPRHPVRARRAGGRPLLEIVLTRRFISAVACGVAAYAMMNLVMT